MFEPERRKTVSRSNDRGMTLVELLVTVSLIGLVTTVISAAIIVVFRSTDSTEGRLSLARSEQSFTTWMPADLAAVNVDVASTHDPKNDPFQLVSGFVPIDNSEAGQPCDSGDISCPVGFVADGTNQVTLRWRTLTTPGPTTLQTNVSYRLVGVGDGYQLVRYQCSGPVGGAATCFSIPVLRDLDGDWSMTTSVPTFDAVEPEYENMAGQQVSVTIDGGLGDASAAAGGSDTVTLTAGGVSMEAISSGAPTGSPSFVREPSRCGGPIVIMVDNSNSIGSTDMPRVRDAVIDFIDAFRLTPVQLQIIKFSTNARVLGDGANGNGYFDMSEIAGVDAAKAQITATNLPNESGSEGGTNWEAGWYRALVEDGKPGPQVMPNTVVFFTDGVPTYYLDNPSGDYGSVTGPGGVFTREGFDEAALVAAPFRRPTPPSIIGVGVNGRGDGLNVLRTWSPGVEKNGRQILAQLVDGTDTGVPADSNPPSVANLYLLDGFGGLTAALQEIALKDCGGTLTVRTRLATGGDGQKFGPEVVYENVGVTEGDGAPRTVATSGSFPTGTFDFDSSTAITTTVKPQVSSSLAGYELDRWDCRAGPTDLLETEFDIDDSVDFKAVEVTVSPNQAASCTMWITPKV